MGATVNVTVVRVAAGVWALCANGLELNRFCTRTAALHSLQTNGLYGSQNQNVTPRPLQVPVGTVIEQVAW